MSERPYGLRIRWRPSAPLLHEDGSPLRPTPYRPAPRQCEVCPGPCCRRHVVHVTLPDVVTLCSALSVPFEHVFRFVAQGGEESFPLGSEDGVDTIVDPFDGRAALALKRREDGSCAALLDLGGFGRCGVHAVRPSNCRLYPVFWESDIATGGPHAIDCRRPYGILPDMAEAFYLDAARYLDHRAIHREVVTAWEESGVEARDGRSFLQFALPRTARALDIDLKRTLDERPPHAWLDELLQNARTPSSRSS